VIVYAFGRLERRGQVMYRVHFEVDAAMFGTVLTDELSRRAQTEPSTGKKRARYYSREFSDME
jgi:hypothetical protein